MIRKRVHTILSDNEMHRIAEVIGEQEKRTAGEIRVALREKRRFGEKKLALHQLAIKEFHRLGMQRTKNRTGVLIFLLLRERQFHIVADEGIHAKVEDGTWDVLAGDMSREFRGGRFCDGICSAVRSVGEILGRFFPVDPGDTNELSNEVSIS